jgi:hypothetical protein
MDLIESYSGDSAPLHEAQARLQRLLDGNPRSAAALAGLGRVAFKQARIVGDQYDSAKLVTALDYAGRAIALEPTFADAYIVQAWAAHEQKDGLAARTALNTALKLAPTSTRALSLAVDLDIGDGDWDAAEKGLVTMLSGSINHRLAAGAFEELAGVYEHAGDLDAADQARRRQIDLEPDSAWAKGDYAQFLGNWAGDIVWAQKALAQLRYGVARQTLAEAYCATGDVLPCHARGEMGVAEAASPENEDRERYRSVDARVRDPAVNGDGVSHDVIARARSEKDGGAGHVVVATDAPKRRAGRDDVLVVPRRAIHLGSERAGSDRAHHDEVLHEVRGHAAREEDQGRLGCLIGVGLERIEPDPVDRSDVDHLGRALRAGGFRERRVEGLGQKERRLDVQVHDLVPAVLWELVERRSPGRARVVHQNVELGFAGEVVGGERATAVEGGYVVWDGDAAAGARELASGGGTLLGLARGDVDLRAGREEAGRDHLPDPARPSGDEGNAVLQ